MTSMTTPRVEAAMAGAFRDVTLGLIGLFHAYRLQSHLFEAAAQMLERVFAYHLAKAPSDVTVRGPESLHKIADELGRVTIPPYAQTAILGSAATSNVHCPGAGILSEEALQLINGFLAEFDKRVTEAPANNQGAVP